ncbi:TetR/AcrR family transcriptional regulator [Nocardia sp. CWNU-33]|uniref:TetR/AcrR family transcriptional regulator n=1 Tax=Nocardia sp. CWNU-33 TaxID=3392117 RepID=UPI00398E74CC
MSTTDRRALIVDGAIDVIATRGIRALTHRAIDTALDLPAGSASYYFRTKRALIEAITDRITSRSRTDFLAARIADIRFIDPQSANAQSADVRSEAAASAAAPAQHLDEQPEESFAAGADHAGSVEQTRLHQADGAQPDEPTPTAQGTPPIDTGDIARAIATWLDQLLADRRNHLIVRHALLIDLLADPDLHPRLVHSLFSVERARDLFHALGFADPAAAAADFVAVIEGAVFDRFAGARSHLPARTPESVDQLTALLSRYLSSRQDST